MLICKFWAYKLCVCVCTVLVHSVFAHTLSMGNVLSVKNSVFPLADCGIIQILNCTSLSTSLESFWKFPRNPIFIKVYRGFLEEMDCLVKNRSANWVDSTVTPTVGWLYCLHDHKSINLISSIKCVCFPRLLCWSLMLHMGSHSGAGRPCGLSVTQWICTALLIMKEHLKLEESELKTVIFFTGFLRKSTQKSS